MNWRFELWSRSGGFSAFVVLHRISTYALFYRHLKENCFRVEDAIYTGERYIRHLFMFINATTTNKGG